MIRYMTVPYIISKMKETSDYETLVKYENMLTCMFASPLMFLGTSSNLIVRYFLWNEDLLNVFIDSLIFLVLGIAFEFVLRCNFSAKVSDRIVSTLYSFWYIFISIRYFQYIGASILIIAFIQVILAITRVSRIMIIMLCISIASVTIYIFNVYQNMQFFTGGIQYSVQVFLFFIMLIVIAFSHNLNILKYKKIKDQLTLTMKQKEELHSLYNQVSEKEIETRNQNEALNFLAHYDTLTELPNRKMILERLNLLVDLSKDKDMAFYVVFIDLDHFKIINDTLGHDFGDVALKKVAKRFKDAVHEKDMIGRLGGDEFALIVQRDLKQEDVLKYIEKIKNHIAKPFSIKGNKIKISASFGISVYPDDGDEALELIKCADTSMYKAKEIGKDCIQFYKKEMKDEIIRKMEVERKILSAFESREFYLVFQPQYSISDKRIRGLEALIRWDSKDLGSIPPNQFIPIVEDMGFIMILGEWILKNACLFFKKLIDEYEIEGNIAVNISTVQLNNDNFLDVIKRVLKETDLQPTRLELEITESLFIKDFDKAIIKLNEIKELGVKIALDDFGTGFSSLSYMRRLPIDTLKIDKSFLDDILLLNLSEKNIVRDIIAMGHSLKTNVVAEGVEHQEQMDYLEYYGCDYVQGFLISKPMEEEDIINVMKKIYI